MVDVAGLRFRRHRHLDVQVAQDRLVYALHGELVSGLPSHGVGLPETDHEPVPADEHRVRGADDHLHVAVLQQDGYVAHVDSVLHPEDHCVVVGGHHLYLVRGVQADAVRQEPAPQGFGPLVAPALPLLDDAVVDHGAVVDHRAHEDHVADVDHLPSGGYRQQGAGRHRQLGVQVQ